MAAAVDRPPSPAVVESSVTEVDDSEDSAPGSPEKGFTSLARMYLPNIVQQEMSKMFASRCDISKEEIVPFKVIMDVINEHYTITNKPEIPRVLIRLLYQYQPINGEIEYKRLVELVEDLLSAIDQEIRDALISMIPEPISRIRSFFQPVSSLCSHLPRDLLGREERLNPFAQTIKKPVLAQKILSSSASQGIFPSSLPSSGSSPNGDICKDTSKHSNFLNSSLAGQNLISKLTSLSSGHNASQICLETLKKSVPQRSTDWHNLNNHIDTDQTTNSFSTLGSNSFPLSLDLSKNNIQGNQLTGQINVGQSWNNSSSLTTSMSLSLPTNSVMWFNRPSLTSPSSRQSSQQIGTSLNQSFLQSSINPLLTSVANSGTITKNDLKKQQLMHRKQELMKCIDSLPKLKNSDGHAPNSGGCNETTIASAAFPFAWLAMSNYGNGIRTPTPQQLTEFFKQHAHQLISKEQKSEQQQDQEENAHSLDSTSDLEHATNTDENDQPTLFFNQQCYFLEQLLKRPASPDCSDPWESVKKTKKIKVISAGSNGANTNKKKSKKAKK